MKKILLYACGILLMAAITSCDTKACKCYVLDRGVYVRETNYVDEGSSCSDLDQNPRRLCTEYYEEDIDPEDMGVMFDKKK